MTSARRPDQDRLASRPAEGHGARGPGAEQEPLRRAGDDGQADRQPDVLLDVPVLRIDEINLEVEDLQARISLQAQVLDLVKLHAGADVSLRRVSLGIKGADAAALLKIRLDNISAILGRVMTTLDDNPQIVGAVSRGLSGTAGEVGRASGQALRDVGDGAGVAVEQVGQGAGGAVEQVDEGAGSAAGSVGDEVGEAAGEHGRDGSPGARPTEEAGDASASAGDAVGDAGGAARAEQAPTTERAAPRGRQVPSSRKG